MVVVNGLGGVAAPRGTPPRRAAGPGGFRLPPEAAEAEAAAPVHAVAMPSLLGLQEAQGDAVSDREARRHAEDTLDALRDMQAALLGGTDRGGTDRLDQLARRMPQAADPRLLAVQRALTLRVAVEAARARAAASL